SAFLRRFEPRGRRRDGGRVGEPAPGGEAVRVGSVSDRCRVSVYACGILLCSAVAAGVQAMRGAPPNKRLKLAGGDRSRGSGVLCAGAHELSFNDTTRGGRVARSLSAIR